MTTLADRRDPALCDRCWGLRESPEAHVHVVRDGTCERLNLNGTWCTCRWRPPALPWWQRWLGWGR